MEYILRLIAEDLASEEVENLRLRLVQVREAAEAANAAISNVGSVPDQRGNIRQANVRDIRTVDDDSGSAEGVREIRELSAELGGLAGSTLGSIGEVVDTSFETINDLFSSQLEDVFAGVDDFLPRLAPVPPSITDGTLRNPELTTQIANLSDSIDREAENIEGLGGVFSALTSTPATIGQALLLRSGINRFAPQVQLDQRIRSGITGQGFGGQTQDQLLQQRQAAEIRLNNSREQAVTGQEAFSRALEREIENESASPFTQPADRRETNNRIIDEFLELNEEIIPNTERQIADLDRVLGGSNLPSFIGGLGIAAVSLVGIAGSIALISTSAAFLARTRALDALVINFTGVTDQISESRRNLRAFSSTLRTDTLQAVSQLGGQTRLIFTRFLTPEERERVEGLALSLSRVSNLDLAQAIELLTIGQFGTLNIGQWTELASEIGLSNTELANLIDTYGFFGAVEGQVQAAINAQSGLTRSLNNLNDAWNDTLTLLLENDSVVRILTGTFDGLAVVTDVVGRIIVFTAETADRFSGVIISVANSVLRLVPGLNTVIGVFNGVRSALSGVGGAFSALQTIFDDGFFAFIGQQFNDFFNGIINQVNGVIRAINLIPGVSIPQIDPSTIGLPQTPPSEREREESRFRQEAENNQRRGRRTTVDEIANSELFTIPTTSRPDTSDVVPPVTPVSPTNRRAGEALTRQQNEYVRNLERRASDPNIQVIVNTRIGNEPVETIIENVERRNSIGVPRAL